VTKPPVPIAAAACAGGAAAQRALPSGAWAGTAQFTRGGGDEAFPISIERGRRSKPGGLAASRRVRAEDSLHDRACPAHADPGETDLWANLNDQGRTPPTRTDEEMEAEVRRSGPSGVDPMPSIRAMRIPAIWLFGAKDRTCPRACASNGSTHWRGSRAATSRT